MCTIRPQPSGRLVQGTMRSRKQKIGCTHSIHGSTQQHTLHKSSRMNALEDKVVVYQIKPEKNGKRSQGAQDGKWGM